MSSLENSPRPHYSILEAEKAMSRAHHPYRDARLCGGLDAPSALKLALREFELAFTLFFLVRL